MFTNLPSVVLLFVGVVCLPAWSHGRSISRVGDINVDITGDVFTCDKIVCPSNTDHCLVTKEYDVNNSGTLLRSTKCYSGDDVVLKQSTTTETSPPNSRGILHILAYRRGTSSVIRQQRTFQITEQISID